MNTVGVEREPVLRIVAFHFMDYLTGSDIPDREPSPLKNNRQNSPIPAEVHTPNIQALIRIEVTPINRSFSYTVLDVEYSVGTYLGIRHTKMTIIRC